MLIIYPIRVITIPGEACEGVFELCMVAVLGRTLRLFPSLRAHVFPHNARETALVLCQACDRRI